MDIQRENLMENDTFEMFRVGHFYGIEFDDNGQLLLTKHAV